jgi:methyltransferase
VVTSSTYDVLLGLVVAERGVELLLSRRNAARLLARGAHEHGRGQVLPMVLLHALFLVGCAVEPRLLDRSIPGAWGPVALAGVVLAQSLRWWAVATLGERWSVRVLALPGAAPVTGGPYRFVRHPNYVAVVIEVACLPLVHGAWITAVAFSCANALFLAARIPCEEAALGKAWDEAFAGRGRFVPGARR